MIRVTVELISANGRDRDRVLGVAEIANVGGTASKGNYIAKLYKGWKRSQRPRLIKWKELSLEDFPRRRLGGWDLLYRILKKAIGDRNNDS